MLARKLQLVGMTVLLAFVAVTLIAARSFSGLKFGPVYVFSWVAGMSLLLALLSPIQITHQAKHLKMLCLFYLMYIFLFIYTWLILEVEPSTILLNSTFVALAPIVLAVATFSQNLPIQSLFSLFRNFSILAIFGAVVVSIAGLYTAGIPIGDQTIVINPSMNAMACVWVIGIWISDRKFAPIGAVGVLLLAYLSTQSKAATLVVVLLFAFALVKRNWVIVAALISATLSTMLLPTVLYPGNSRQIDEYGTLSGIVELVNNPTVEQGEVADSIDGDEVKLSEPSNHRVNAQWRWEIWSTVVQSANWVKPQLGGDLVSLTASRGLQLASRHPHNYWVGSLFFFGVFLTVWFFVCILMIFKTIRVGMRDKGERGSVTSTVILYLIAAFLVGLTDVALENPAFALSFWTMAGIGIGISRGDRAAKLVSWFSGPANPVVVEPSKP